MSFESGQVKLDKIQQKGNKESFSSTLISHFDIWMQQIAPDNIEVSLLSVHDNHGRQRVRHG